MIEVTPHNIPIIAQTQTFFRYWGCFYTQHYWYFNQLQGMAFKHPRNVYNLQNTQIENIFDAPLPQIGAYTTAKCRGNTHIIVESYTKPTTISKLHRNTYTHITKETQIHTEKKTPFNDKKKHLTLSEKEHKLSHKFSILPFSLWSGASYIRKHIHTHVHILMYIRIHLLNIFFFVCTLYKTYITALLCYILLKMNGSILRLCAEFFARLQRLFFYSNNIGLCPIEGIILTYSIVLGMLSSR